MSKEEHFIHDLWAAPCDDPRAKSVELTGFDTRSGEWTPKIYLKGKQKV